MSTTIPKTPTEYKVQSTKQLNLSLAGFVSGATVILSKYQSLTGYVANVTVIVFNSRRLLSLTITRWYTRHRVRKDTQTLPQHSFHTTSTVAALAMAAITLSVA